MKIIILIKILEIKEYVKIMKNIKKMVQNLKKIINCFKVLGTKISN